MLKRVNLKPVYFQKKMNYHNLRTFSKINCRMFASSSKDTEENVIDVKNKIKSKTYYEAYKNEINNLKQDIYFIAEQFEKKRYNTNRIKYTIFFVSVLFVFTSWRTIKSFITNETSDVAIKTINNHEVKKSTLILLDGLIDYVNTDPTIRKKLPICC